MDKEANFPLIELRSKDPNKLTTGANAELLIDGKVQTAVTEVNINIKAGGLADVKVSYVGRIKANVLGKLEQHFIDCTPDQERHEAVAEEMRAALKSGQQADPSEILKQKECPPHDWSKDGERCCKCGTKDWMT